MRGNWQDFWVEEEAELPDEPVIDEASWEDQEEEVPRELTDCISDYQGEDCQDESTPSIHVPQEEPEKLHPHLKKLLDQSEAWEVMYPQFQKVFKPPPPTQEGIVNPPLQLRQTIPAPPIMHQLSPSTSRNRKRRNVIRKRTNVIRLTPHTTNRYSTKEEFHQFLSSSSSSHQLMQIPILVFPSHGSDLMVVHL